MVAGLDRIGAVALRSGDDFQKTLGVRARTDLGNDLFLRNVLVADAPDDSFRRGGAVARIPAFAAASCFRFSFSGGGLYLHFATCLARWERCATRGAVGMGRIRVAPGCRDRVGLERARVLTSVPPVFHPFGNVGRSLRRHIAHRSDKRRDSVSGNQTHVAPDSYLNRCSSARKHNSFRAQPVSDSS